MGKAQDGEIVTKGEFAHLSGVTPGRISQWIGEGKISAAALVGEGRSAKIRVLRAQADLKRNLDPNQMTANGIRTRIPGGPLQPPPPPLPDPPPPKRRPADQPEISDREPQEVDAADLVSEKARLTRAQSVNWEMRNRERAGELIEHAEAERRWTEEIVDLRSRTLAVAGELPTLLPHLSADDIAVIDRAYRDAMHRAAGGGA